MKKTIPFIVPCFSGFYNSIWSADEVGEAELAMHFDCEEEDITCEILDSMDYDKYKQDVAIECAYFICGAIEEALHITGVNPQNEKVISPREYNFYTDKIECELVVNDYDALISAMEQYISEHHDLFVFEAKKSFTSCDGFISFYSNKFDELDWKNKEVLFSWVIEVILNYENNNLEDSMYDHVVGHGTYPECYFMEPDDHTKARDIIKHFDPVAIKISEDNDGLSVLIKDKYSSLEFWMDFWLDGNNEIGCDWNEWIFYTSGIDATRKEIQEDLDVFESCYDIALDELQKYNKIYEDNEGK